MRPQEQMEMVCHQTKPRQPHRHLLVSLPHQVHKRGKIVICVKNVAAAIEMIGALLSRFMPAIPIADRSAPIVVSARQTNRATSTVRLIAFPCPEI